MNFFEKLLYFLQAEMNEPKPFGWFHLMWIGFVIIAIIILYLMRKKHNDKQLKIVLGVYGIPALIFELLKQLIWAFNYDTVTGVITWEYEWYAAPFQLCTTPIFISVICLFLGNNKLRKYLLSYMAYITILGSFMTMLIPNSCFVSDILVNIHTMWLHLGSFVVSVYLFLSGEVEINIKNLVRAIIVFLGFIVIAEVLNILVYNSGVLNGDTFNMFYISPYFNSTLPVFDMIQKSVPFILFLIIYIIALSLGGFIVYFIAFSIKKLKRLLK